LDFKKLLEIDIKKSSPKSNCQLEDLSNLVNLGEMKLEALKKFVILNSLEMIGLGSLGVLKILEKRGII
jgi:hypothetical protein